MLAQNFKSPAALGLTDAQHAALCKTLVLMETGQLRHVPSVNKRTDRHVFSGQFNMNFWYSKGDCGTIACIAGTAEMVGGLRIGELVYAPHSIALGRLFWGTWTDKQRNDITVPEAAQALRNYLTYGDARGEYHGTT